MSRAARGAVVVDAHQHVWDPGLLSYPWLADEPRLNAPFLPDHSLDDAVDRVVFVQADAADGAAEAEWVQGLASSWPQLAAIVAYAPVEAPDLGAALDRLGTLPLLRGVRRLLQDEPSRFIDSDAIRRGLRVLAARGLPFDACVRHHQLGELVRVAQDVPECTVVLDHLGKPPVAQGLGSRDGAAWADAMHSLAALPSVFAKLSGLAPEADPARPLAEQAVPFLEFALEVFGPARCMVGSDWPVSAVTPHRLATSEWFELVGTLAPDRPSRDLVLGGTASAVYRIGP